MKHKKISNLLLNKYIFALVLVLVLVFMSFFVDTTFAQLPIGVVPAQCSDSKDNDEDGYADWGGVPENKGTLYPPDPACATREDTNEYDEPSGVIIPCTDKCGLGDVFALINNVIKFIITRLFFPFFIFIILFIGYKYISAGGNAGKVAGVKKMIRNVVIGVILILCAWLLVRSALYFVGYKDALLFFD